MKNKIWLISYLRSGSTWLRFLLANLLYPNEDVDYVSLDRLVPDFTQIRKWGKLGVVNPVAIKSHFVWWNEYADSKIIYLYRDVRDVALSYYHFQQGEWDIGFKGTFDEYLEKRFFVGQDYGRWDSHVNFWLYMSNGFPLLFVKYEDLWKDTFEEVRKIVGFLDIKVDTVDINRAIKKSDFGELEKIRARDGVHPKKKGLRGRPGGWRENLTRRQQDLIWEKFGKTMKKLGYRKE